MNAHTREDDTVEAPPYVRATTMAPPQARLRDTRSKSPAVAAVLSMMPGLGQLQLGYYQRGFLHAAVVATLVTILASGAPHRLSPPFALFNPSFMPHHS